MISHSVPLYSNFQSSVVVALSYDLPLDFDLVNYAAVAVEHSWKIACPNLVFRDGDNVTFGYSAILRTSTKDLSKD